MDEELQRKYDMLTQSAEYWIDRAARAEADRDRLAAENARLYVLLAETVSNLGKTGRLLYRVDQERDRLRAALEKITAVGRMADSEMGVYSREQASYALASAALADPAREGQG